MAHTRKRIRKLSTAVFRGLRSEYDFTVYPISTSVTDLPAVFIFSRRKVDKLGRGHHVVCCVGETDSIVSEIRRHRRARCVRSGEANVVCILKQPDRSIRDSVMEDIIAARAFRCVRGKLRPGSRTTVSRPDPSTAGSVRVLTFERRKKAVKDGSAESAAGSRAKTRSLPKDTREQANKKGEGQKPFRTKRVLEKQPRTTIRTRYRMKRAA